MFGQPRCSFMLTFACVTTLAMLASACSDALGGCSSAIPAEMPDMLQSFEKSDLYLLQTSLDLNKKGDHGKEGSPTTVTKIIGHRMTSLDMNRRNAHAKRKGVAVHDGLLPAARQSNDTATVESAAEATGVTLNQAGDLLVFITGLITNGITMLFCVGFFLLARSHYPGVYEGQIIAGIAPKFSISKSGLLDWAYMSCQVTLDQIQDTAGLDQAMLMEFCHLGMKIMAIVGIPMICIAGPMNWIFGGHAAGEDRLSYLSFGNVENGSKLYWIHAFIVWAVVFCVQVFIYRSMDLFMVQRQRWLEELPEIQANTVMVQEIPEDMQSDEALKAYFEKIWGSRKVKSATVVKICPELVKTCQYKKILILAMDRARKEESEGKTPKRSVQEIQSEIADITKKIGDERVRVLAEAATPGKVTASTGFVTFFERYDAEITASAIFSHDVDEWVVSQPPPPETIAWGNLQQSDSKKGGYKIFGYALVAGLYLAYLPLVIRISQLAVEIDMGPFQSLWGAFAPTLGLQIMVAFLPTFLRLIFIACFSLSSEAEDQVMVQTWYFVFQVVFVLLVTAIGASLWDVMVAIATEPFSVFLILGTAMPPATHFYMNFLVLQWAAHFSNLVRGSQLVKYIFFSRFYDPAQAKEMAEPEDQDYYGLGSRSARFTINFCIGIVFGTLSPPINLLVFINFAACRLVYGYLVVFAETKKPDLGGEFWVHQLKHLFVGNIIYCILMTGVLLGRSDSMGPGIIALTSLAYVLWSSNRFKNKFSWERLSISEVVSQKRNQKGSERTYVQPEFVDN